MAGLSVGELEGSLRLQEQFTAQMANVLAIVSKQVDAMQKQLESLEKKSDSVAQGIQLGFMIKVGEKMFDGLRSAVTAIPGFIQGAIASTVEWGGVFTDTAARIGTSTIALQQWKVEGSLVGVDMQTIAQSANLMQRNLVNNSAAFTGLGLSVANLRAMKPEDAFNAVAKRIAEIPTQADKAAAAMDAFGRGGLALLPLLSSGYGNAAAAAERLGIIMSEQVVAAADDVGDKVTMLTATFEGFEHNIGAAVVTSEPLHILLEGLTEIMGSLSGSVNDSQASLRGLVDGGIILVANALEVGIKAVGYAIDIWSGFKIGVIGVTSAIEILVMWLMKEAEAILHPTQAIALFKAGMKEMEGIALKGADAIQVEIKSNTDRRNVIDSVAAQMDALAVKIAAADGITHKSAEGVKAHGEAYNKLTKDAKAAAKAAEDAAKALLKKNEEEGKELIRLNSQQMKATETLNEQLAKHFEKTSQDKIKADQDWWDEQQKIQDEYDKTWHAIAEDDAKRAEERKNQWLDLGDTIASIGKQMGGMFGSIGSIISTGISAWKNYGKELTNVQKAQAAVAAGMTALNIIQSNKDNMSGANAAMNGAAQGAAAGLAFGPVGAIVGGLAGAILGFFSGSKFRAIANTAGKTLGVEMSKELTKAVEATMKKFNVKADVAALLNLDKAMAESTKSAGEFAPQVLALFAGIASKAIPAAEGVKQIGLAFSRMAEEAAKDGGIASQAMLATIAASNATGIRVKEVQDFVQQTVTTGANGIAAMFAYLGQKAGATAEDFQRVGGFALAGIAAMKEQGFTLLQIFEAIGPALDAALAAAQKAGVEIGGAFGELLNFRQLIEDNKLLVASVEGTSAVILMLYNTGKLTGDNLHNILTQGQKDYDDLRNAGFSNIEALTIQQDSLRTLDKLYREGKITLDETTKAHIEEARAAGLLDPTPQEQMLAATQQMNVTIALLAQAMGVKLPEAIRKSIAEWEKLNKTASQTPGQPSAPKGPPTNYNDPNRERTGFATGLFSRALPMDINATLHKGERVEITPASQTASRNAADSGLSMVARQVAGLRQDFAALPSTLVRAMRVARQQEID